MLQSTDHITAPAPDGGLQRTRAGKPAVGSGQQVAILMGTANGERYLGEQLASLEAQTHTDWTLHVSDDGSTDGTLEILAAFQRRLGADRVFVRPGPRRGFAANFLTLACNPEIDGDYFAFCDQDDIWRPERLARSLASMASADPTRPMLYCSRTRYVDELGKELGLSPLFSLPPDFRNALVQSLGGGNTMLFNRAARALVMKAGVRSVVAHDWWLYLLIAGCEGTVHYDPEPTVDYRQHTANVIGSNTGLRARIWRGKELVKGRFRRWNDVNERELRAVRELLSPRSRAVLETFSSGRRGNLLDRLAAVPRSGVYRQTAIGNLGLWFGGLLNRL